jgi:protein-S-isoprenylcysteine O-methyltransferase Ste14
VAVLALVLCLVWAFLAFGLRGWLQWRATGDAGFRGAGLRVGSAQWWVRLLFVVAALATPAGAIAELAGMDALGVLDQTVIRIAGLLLALAGVVATVSAQWSMGESWRIGVDEQERTELVTRGAFALARNPIFTGMIVTVAGLAAMVPNVLALAGLVLMVGAIQLQVRAVEEPYLRRMHGQDYDRYAATVGRFVPWAGRG